MTWHSGSLKEILSALNTDAKRGLSEKEAEIRLEKYGKNIIADKKRTGLLKKFSEQFKDFMIIILLVAAFVSFVTSVMNGETDFADPIIILCIVVFNAIVGVVQENRTEKSIEALKKIAAPTAEVFRGGKRAVIAAERLVPGDIVSLKAGSRVSADCRIIESVGLTADESMLTGESMPAEKSAEVISERDVPLAERSNMLWSGSMIISGKCTAAVCSTGIDTEMGNIASMIMSEEIKETPLGKKLSEVGKTLGTAALLICAVIFVIGIYKSIPPFEMFLTAVSLAVAAIPEGLPAIVTVMLAIGVQRMAKKGAIVRHLPSVETLGCANVICTDKTGTLTENKMSVVCTYTEDVNKLFYLGAVASDTESRNPTEAAILNEAERLKIKNIDKKIKAEIPFSSETKKMSVLAEDNGTYLSVTKGAADVVIDMCGFVRKGTEIVPITAAERRKILYENEKMAQKALRVIAVAYKENAAPSAPVEENLVFMGLIGMEDPPKKSVKRAVSLCKAAGIVPVMITGDHPKTALAIAEQTGILQGKEVMTGKELDKMPQEALEKNIEKYSVFARVTPEHKVRLVKAWQKHGAVVAMTGDGVNDAPALKCADIGCSMGIAGTDVAKNASDMILTDDNFATIVKAVREGRGIFTNIRKSVQFLLSSNIGEILTVFLGILFGWQTPLLAVQLLWINLVTDSLPAIALGLDPPEDEIMTKPPRNPKKSLFADGMWLALILEGSMIGAAALLAFVIGIRRYDLRSARTMAFCVLSLSQLVHAFNMRSEHSVFSVGLFSNKYLVGAFLAGVILQCSVVAIKPIAEIFKVGMPSPFGWTVIALLSVSPLVIVEIQKFINARRRKG